MNLLNPFRCYPLQEDYQDFKELFQQQTACFLLNTGDFQGRNITPEEMLDSIEKVITGTATFQTLPT